jgi:hypothetical protein
MYHTCRWCKHYENGCCTKAKEIFYVSEWDTDYSIEEVADFEIKEPESFYCKEWE